MEDQVYCSIDLELSGFDPAKDEILEVGFVLFRYASATPEIIEEWTQVFKPHTEVRHKILGLTGINPSELEVAPQFDEYREFLTGKLSNTILVGHGITMDIRFLEAFGVSCPPVSIDTLDLVQWLLPTHHSYNLENVMHFLGLAHTEAHRALADSKAVMHLLERLLAIYNSLPDEVRTRVGALAKKHTVSWAGLLDIIVPPKPLENNFITEQLRPAKGEIEQNTVTLFPLKDNIEESTIQALPQDTQLIVSFPNKASVLSLWRSGVMEGFFGAKDSFDEEKFNALLKSSVSSKELLLFVFKVLVWKHTNWQTKTILDLNLSFSGSQFKSLITRDKPSSLPDVDMVCTDHSTFTKLAKSGGISSRQAVVCDLLAFERTLAESSGVRLSWYRVLSVLKGIYNPETETGFLDHKDEVLEALSATDLFFGLISLTLKQLKLSESAISLAELRNRDAHRYSNIAQSAENYIKKIEGLAKHFPEVSSIGDGIARFFEEDESIVQWIEFTDTYVALHRRPLELSKPAQEVVHAFSSISFTDTVADMDLVRYVLARLGLPGVSINNHPLIGHSATVVADLSREPLLLDHARVMVIEQDLPMVITFSSILELKQFYDENYKDLQKFLNIFAEKYSGGVNKLFRNFSLRKNSLLLVTNETLMGARSHTIRAHKLVIQDLGEKSKAHPYEKSLEQYWSGTFPNFRDLSNTQRLHDILVRFNWEQLHSVQIFGLQTEDREKKVTEVFFSKQ